MFAVARMIALLRLMDDFLLMLFGLQSINLKPSIVLALMVICQISLSTWLIVFPYL